MTTVNAPIVVKNKQTGFVQIVNMIVRAPFGAFSAPIAARYGYFLTEDEEWVREPTPEVVHGEVSRLFNLDDYDYALRTYDDLPSTAIFREAWRENNGKVAVDMSIGRDMHMAEIRRARNALLEKKDAEWMREFSRGNQAGADAIEAERQILRDIPQNINADVKAVWTPEELAAVWPKELGDRRRIA